MITVEQWDIAWMYGRLEVTHRRNARVVRCAVEGCRAKCKVGAARRVYIDGMPRGFACGRCRQGHKRFVEVT